MELSEEEGIAKGSWNMAWAILSWLVLKTLRLPVTS